MAACGAAGRGFESLWARSDIGAFKWVLTYKRSKERVEVEQLQSDPWTLYLYAMKSPVTRDKYQKRLGMFFDFIRLEAGSIEDKSKVFVEKARKDSNWTFSNILKFIQFQNSRVIQKEISECLLESILAIFKR